MTDTLDATVAIIGCGTMGEAIVGGALQAGVLDPARTLITARRDDRARATAERHGVQPMTDNALAASRADIVVLCVKPQVAHRVLTAPGVAKALSNTVLVSDKCLNSKVR